MSDLEDDYDYFPMWTKVLDPQESLKHVEQNIRPGGSFYYFNNFNGQTQTTPPTSEYTPALDDNYKNEKLVFRDMPIDMSQLFASKRLQTIARARTARKRIRRIKGDNKFNQMSEEERKAIREDHAGWIQLIDFTNKQGNKAPYWYHPGTVVEAWNKPSAATEAEIVAVATKKKRDIANRRKEHKEKMANGLKEQHAIVDAIEEKKIFIQKKRDERALEHQTNLNQLHDALHVKHDTEIEEKIQKIEKQKEISAERAVLHEAKMNELEHEQLTQQNEHDKMVHDLERRASLILESNSGPWKLRIGIKNATGLRAADWAMRGKGASDPYVRVFLNGKDIGKTKVLKKTLEPVWNAFVDVDIQNTEELGASNWNTSELIVKIYDYDVVGSDDLLGQIVFKDNDLTELLGLTIKKEEEEKKVEEKKEEDTEEKTEDKDETENQTKEGEENEKVEKVEESKMFGEYSQIQKKRSMNSNTNELTYTTHSLADPSGETIKKKEMATGELTLAADLRVVLKKRQVIDAKKGSKAQANKKQKELEHQQKMAHSLDSEHLKAQYHAETGVLIAEAMLPLDQNIIKEWVMETTFVSATGLKKADRWGKSDPYVQVYVNGSSIGSSSTIKKSLNPEWNEKKDFLVRRKKHMKNKKGWKNTEVIFEVYDHDLVGMDDPLGRIVLKGEELLGMLTSQTRGKETEETIERQLFERNGKKAKGTLCVTASLKPAKTEDVAAANREKQRLAEIEARKVDAPWTVWIRLYDNIAHAEYFVHSMSGSSMFDLPIPTGSTKEIEIRRFARVLPEELLKGAPIYYREHAAARLISNVFRKKKAKTIVLMKRGELLKTKNSGGSHQIWVKAFDPHSCRNYYWNSTTNAIVWDTPPEDMVKAMNTIIRSYDGGAEGGGRYYYHTLPFDKDSWTYELPNDFTPGGKTKVVTAATKIQGMYRSFCSRMGNTRKGERKSMFTFSSFADTPKAKRKLKITQQKQRKKSLNVENSTADERAEKTLNKSILRLEDIITNFELPYRHRKSRRPDRRKVLNKTHEVIVLAVTASIAAGNRIAASRGMTMTQQLAKPSSGGGISDKRTTQQIMVDEVDAFTKKVSEASDAVQGASAMVAWYEVETVYRLKRLLAGLTAMDIYCLPAPAHEDVNAAHSLLKTSIHDSEEIVNGMLDKLGKGFRKSLRRWGKMMNEDCGRSLANVSTADLLPVDRTIEGNTNKNFYGKDLSDPLRYGRYYWMTIQKTRMMPFPVDMGGISFKRMKSYIAKMSNVVYAALKQAKIYLMLMGDERDERIGREELLRMRKEEAHIRTCMYMAKLRAEKRAKQLVFVSMCQSQWSTGQTRRVQEEKEEQILQEKINEEKLEIEKVKIIQRQEKYQNKIQHLTSPWDVIKHKGSTDVLREKLGEEHKRWAFQEKKVFDVNSRATDTGESLVGNAVIYNHPEALQDLIDLGADVNQIDSLTIRSTPLHQAARRGDRWVEVAKILVQNGAILSSIDVRGDNALHIASRSGSERMVRFLLSCRNGHRYNDQRRYHFPDPLTESHERCEGEDPDMFGEDFWRMVACPNNRSHVPLDLAHNTGTFEAIQIFNQACGERAEMDDDDDKYLAVRRRRALKKEQERLAEDLDVFGGGGLTMAPLLGPMSSRPQSGDLPDSVRLRNRLEMAKKKHKMRRLKGLPGKK